jgi:sirohydrochlorin ferrochelatase
VVPFFMEDGYFTRVAIPKALGRSEGIILCPPIGLHEEIAGLIASRGRDGCVTAGFTPADTAIVVVGHGSARSPGRALALHRHSTTVAGSRQFASVQVACLEEAPFLDDVLRGLRGLPVGLVGFFAGEGGHVREDVPEAIAAEQRARGPAGPLVLNFGTVTDNAALAQIILDQANAA